MRSPGKPLKKPKKATPAAKPRHRQRRTGKPNGCPPGSTLLERRGLPFVDDLLKRIRVTDSIPTAAEACGVDGDTVYRWRATGEMDIADGHPETLFAVLAAGIKKARAEFEIDNLATIRRASLDKPAEGKAPPRAGHWQAAAWLLERRRPEFKLGYEPPTDKPTGDVKVLFINELPPEPPAKPKDGNEH